MCVLIDGTSNTPTAMPRRQRLGAWLALSLTLATLPVASTALTPAETSRSRNNPAHIDLSDYDLAWQAFLGASQLDDAMTLARRTLVAYPDSVLWHRRLASVAQQNNDAPVAARNYAWLATRGHQFDLLDRAIDLSTATLQDDLAIRLMQQRAAHEAFNAGHWRALIDAMLNLGQFDQALTTLRQADQRHPRQFFLSQQANVLLQAGRPAARAAVLRRMIARYGAAPETVLQLASLEYAQGRTEQALATLRLGQPLATAKDAAYWQTLSSLAWMLQDFDEAASASRILVRAGSAQAADYQRLYQVHIANQPAVAYAYALIGWRRTHASPLFFQALAAASQLGPAALSQTLFDSIRPQDRATLEGQPQFWMQWAQLAHQQGNDKLARSRYAQALRRAPSDAHVIGGYLWLLIDSHDTPRLSILTRRWGNRLLSDSTVREGLTAALAMLDQPGRALRLMEPALASHRDDSAWLMQYADLLDQTDQADTATAIRRQAVKPLLQQTARAHGKTARARQLDRIALTSQLAPGDPTRRAMRMLINQPDGTRARDQVLAWTTSLDNTEATALWLRRHYTTTPAPGWTLLGQAMATDNDTATMHLLTTDADRLPRRDRVSAAEKLGFATQAVTLAWRGLEGEPDDRRLQRQFQTLALAQADTVGSSLAELRSSGLAAFDLELNARRWITPALHVEVEAHRIRQVRYDASQLGSIPGYGQYGSIQLTEQLARGERGLSLGGGRDLAGYGQLGAFYRYRLRRNLQLAAAIDYGARANDTVPLMMAGLIDRLKTSADYQWSAADSLTATATVSRLRAQGGGRLGNRQTVDLQYRHKLWLAPPDFTLVATATDARYQAAGSLPTNMLRLLPTGQPADIGYFVPRSYVQACLGAGFNENFREEWSGQLRPFGTASVCHNSVSGLGASVDAGLATPVIGPDHLSLGLGFTNNTGATSSRSLSILVNYRYYFTP